MTLLKLRDGVAVETDSGRPLLVDSAFERRIPLGRLTEALARALAQERAPELLCAELAQALNSSLADVEEALRSLLLLGALDGPLSGVARLAVQARGALRPPVRALPRARFGCQSSGQCCRIFRPGPLGPGDLANLEAARAAVETSYPELGGEWVEDLAAPGATPRRYLRRREGQCMFLLADHRCAIHASAGFEFKPEPCRAFPYDAVRTLHDQRDELRVFEVGHCASQLRASEAGPSHAEAAPETAALAPERPSLFHPVVLLGGGLPADYALVWTLEARLGALQAEGLLALDQRLPRALALSAAFVSALRACPLETDAPQRVLEQVVARDVRGETPPLSASDPVERAAAWTRVATSLRAALAAPEEREAPLADALGESLALAEAEALLEARLLVEVPPLITALARCGLPEARAATLLARVWRGRLFGARLLVAGHLEAGLLRLVLLERLTLTGARARAAARGEDRASEEDLEAAHWVAATVLDRDGLRPALLEVGHLVWSL